MTNDTLFSADKISVTIHAEVSPKVSFALQQNGFPVIHEIVIKNDEEYSLENTRVDINASPQFFKPYSCALPDIHGHASYSIDSIGLTIEHEQLSRLVESEKGTLTILTLPPKSMPLKSSCS